MSGPTGGAVEVREVEAVEADELVGAGAFLLDVREDDEWAAGRAPAAHHLALGELGARLAELPSDRTVVVVCRSGGRSHAAAEVLVAHGLDARNLTGGMRAWSAAGLPVETESGDAGTVI